MPRGLRFGLSDPNPIAARSGATLAFVSAQMFQLQSLWFDPALHADLTVYGLRIDRMECFAGFGMRGLPLALFERHAPEFCFAPRLVQSNQIVRLSLLNHSAAPVALLHHDNPLCPERIWLEGMQLE